MTIKEIVEDIEMFAPLGSQESWDNSGLQVGRVDVNCSGAFITLDVTMDAVAAAVKCGANLIISHHPLLFDPIKNITNDSLSGQIIIEAIKNNITIYSSHTPFDIAQGGINDYLAQKLELIEVENLSASGVGRVGVLRQRMTDSRFAEFLKEKLNLTNVRINAKIKPFVSKIAVCGGAGGSLIEDAIRMGADVFVTGDVKYHNFIMCQNVISIADVGHFESECQFIHLVDDIISKKITTFASHVELRNPTVVI